MRKRTEPDFTFKIGDRLVGVNFDLRAGTFSFEAQAYVIDAEDCNLYLDSLKKGLEAVGATDFKLSQEFSNRVKEMMETQLPRISSNAVV